MNIIEKLYKHSIVQNSCCSPNESSNFFFQNHFQHLIVFILIKLGQVNDFQRKVNSVANS